MNQEELKKLTERVILNNRECCNDIYEFTAKLYPLIVEDTLKQVGKWGDMFCIEHGFKPANTRKRECRKCWDLLKSGKKPWEE